MEKYKRTTFQKNKKTTFQTSLEKGQINSENHNGRMLHQLPGKKKHLIPDKPLAGTQF